MPRRVNVYRGIISLKRKIIAGSLALFILTAFCGCENAGRPDNDPAEETASAEEEKNMYAITDDFVITIPEGSKYYAKAANILKKGLSEAGINLKFEDDSNPVHEHEIILGRCAREDGDDYIVDPSSGNMPGGWRIRLTESGNLVVSGEASDAARWLLENCVNDGKFAVEEGMDERYAPGDWEIVFEDDFDGDELDETKWARAPEWARADVGNFWSDDMSFVDGKGHYVCRADIVDGVPLSGAVRTYETFRSTYGYYEICCTLHQAQGMWGAFWMMLGPDVGGGDGVEVDIFESLANVGKIYFTLHYDGYGENHKSAGTGVHMPEIFDGSFHRFGLLWNEEGYKWYMDGVEVFSANQSIVSKPGYMKISTECGSWGGKLDESQLPSDMLVDYVRVWQRK